MSVRHIGHSPPRRPPSPSAGAASREEEICAICRDILNDGRRLRGHSLPSDPSRVVHHVHEECMNAWKDRCFNELNRDLTCPMGCNVLIETMPIRTCQQAVIRGDLQALQQLLADPQAIIDPEDLGKALEQACQQGFWEIIVAILQSQHMNRISEDQFKKAFRQLVTQDYLQFDRYWGGWAPKWGFIIGRMTRFPQFQVVPANELGSALVQSVQWHQCELTRALLQLPRHQEISLDALIEAMVWALREEDLHLVESLFEDPRIQTCAPPHLQQLLNLLVIHGQRTSQIEKYEQLIKQVLRALLEHFQQQLSGAAAAPAQP